MVLKIFNRRQVGRDKQLFDMSLFYPNMIGEK